MNQTPTDKIMFMLGELSSDVKTILGSQAEMKGLIKGHDDRIGSLEKNETARVARAGIFGMIGGVIVTGALEWAKIKFLGFLK